MATRFMYKALAIAALGIALSFLLAETTAASSAWSNTAEALQLDVPAAPSGCRARYSYSRRWQESSFDVSWRDNSQNETGFTVETWHRNQITGVWQLWWAENFLPNTTTAKYGFDGDVRGEFKFRVKAFNASGDSAWSNWTH